MRNLFFVGDDNTQIRFPAADIFTVETGGTEDFVIRGEDIFIANTANDEGWQIFNVDGSVDSFIITVQDGKKFENPDGVIVTGIATVRASSDPTIMRWNTDRLHNC